MYENIYDVIVDLNDNNITAEQAIELIIDMKNDRDKTIENNNKYTIKRDW